MILMDNEFKKVQEHIPGAKINMPAMAKHIDGIEWKIRVIKECCRGIICNLLFKKCP
jgi:hypothetical protein